MATGKKNEIVGQSWCIKEQIRERCWAAPGGSGRYLIHLLHLLALEKQVASHTLHSYSYTNPREIGRGGGGTKKAEQSKEKAITRWTGPVWAYLIWTAMYLMELKNWSRITSKNLMHNRVLSATFIYDFLNIFSEIARTFVANTECHYPNKKPARHHNPRPRPRASNFTACILPWSLTFCSTIMIHLSSTYYCIYYRYCSQWWSQVSIF